MRSSATSPKLGSARRSTTAKRCASAWTGTTPSCVGDSSRSSASWTRPNPPSSPPRVSSGPSSSV